MFEADRNVPDILFKGVRGPSSTSEIPPRYIMPRVFCSLNDVRNNTSKTLVIYFSVQASNPIPIPSTNQLNVELLTQRQCESLAISRAHKYKRSVVKPRILISGSWATHRSGACENLVVCYD